MFWDVSVPWSYPPDGIPGGLPCEVKEVKGVTSKIINQLTWNEVATALCRLGKFKKNNKIEFRVMAVWSHSIHRPSTHRPNFDPAYLKIVAAGVRSVFSWSGSYVLALPPPSCFREHLECDRSCHRWRHRLLVHYRCSSPEAPQGNKHTNWGQLAPNKAASWRVMNRSSYLFHFTNWEMMFYWTDKTAENCLKIKIFVCLSLHKAECSFSKTILGWSFYSR